MDALRKRNRRRLLNGLLFTSPWIIGLLAFYVYPILASLYYSFTSYNVFEPPKWVGTANYVTLLTSDDSFRTCAYNSVVYALMAIPSALVVGVIIAFLLNAKIAGVSFYRALYFLPVLVPAVASAVIWQWVLNPRFGVVNALLGTFGLPGLGWLTDPQLSKPSLALINVWGVGQSVVIYLASLQDVPRDLLDAAQVDGANNLQRIWYVSVPFITPVIFYNLIMGTIGAFQVFTLPFVITGGDGSPAQSLLFYAMYLYRQAFVLLAMGRASAMAWMLFAVVLAATLLIFKTSGRWVYYSGAETTTKA